MPFQDARIELQAGMGGPSLVLKNREGYAVVIDDVESDDVDAIIRVFGDGVQDAHR